MISSFICRRNGAKNFERMCFLAEMKLLNSSSLGSINSNIVGIVWHWGLSLALREGVFKMCVLRWIMNVHE